MILWGRSLEDVLGFTFLEFPRELNELATRQHTVGAQTFTEDEMLVLPGGVDPNDLYTLGIRRLSARRWATLVLHR